MRLSIIVLNYNTKDYLRKALKSLEFHAIRDSRLRGKIELLVVDNASADGSTAMVKKEFPRLTLIKSQENAGFAAGNNLGIHQAKGEYIMLFNSDAVLTGKGSLAILLDYMDAHPDIAVCTPKVVLEGGVIDPACHRGFPTPWNALTYFGGLETLAQYLPLVEVQKLFGGYHRVWENLETVHDIDSCSGAAMIVRKKAIDQVGMLDERFFMYAEDIDWCYRFKQAGWRVVYHPAAQVLHFKYKSGLGHAKEKQKTGSAFYATMTQFYDKHYTHAYPRPVVWFVKLGIQIIKSLKGA